MPPKTAPGQVFTLPQFGLPDDCFIDSSRTLRAFQIWVNALTKVVETAPDAVQLLHMLKQRMSEGAADQAFLASAFAVATAQITKPASAEAFAALLAAEQQAYHLAYLLCTLEQLEMRYDRKASYHTEDHLDTLLTNPKSATYNTVFDVETAKGAVDKLNQLYSDNNYSVSDKELATAFLRVIPTPVSQEMRARHTETLTAAADAGARLPVYYDLALRIERNFIDAGTMPVPTPTSRAGPLPPS
jgi:hypothetical protein